MLELLRAWLNGSKDFTTGVALYEKTAAPDNVLLSLFKKGATPFTTERLQEELIKICNQLKAQINGKANSTPISSAPAAKTNYSPANEPGDAAIIPAEDPKKNDELYNACKDRADKKYKEVMNTRAILFAMAAPDDLVDINTPEKTESRRQLALDVVTGQQEYSRLYSIADYVKEHGHLPDQPLAEENSLDNLPDYLVFYKLDGTRKNYNKIKKLQENPERIALLQKHKSDIEKLEHRWHLLLHQ